jgi:hypothetical protein
MQPIPFNDLKIGEVYLCLRKDGKTLYYCYSELNGNKHYGEQVNRYGQFIAELHLHGLQKLYSHSSYYAINSEFEIIFKQLNNE